MPVSASFARVLAAGRPQFNARVAEARRRSSGFAAEEFSAFLQTAVDGVVSAVDSVAPDRTGAAALAVFDVALVLVGHGLAGPGARHPLVNRLWAEVLPPLARHVAQAPAEVVGALSNAAVRLGSSAEVRGAEWVERMASLAPRVGSVAQLLDLGTVLAWRCGAAHYRMGALAAADRLVQDLALAAVDAGTGASWPQVRAAFFANPWWFPGQAGSKSAEVGAFTGFGGTFSQPPELRTAPEGFWVRSGKRCSLLVADAWGAVLLPAAAHEFEASPPAGRPAEPKQQGSRLVFAGRTVELDLPAEGLRVLANDHTAAVVSPYSHAIRLFALQ